MSSFVLTMPTKVCSTCGKSLPLTEFYMQSYTKQLTSQCKTCINVKRGVERHKAKHGKFISKERIRGFEEPDYSFQDWKDVMTHFRGECPFCGKPEGRARVDKHDRDHVVAISKGGKTERRNIIPACRKCNRGRGNKDWFVWFSGQDFFDEERAALIRAWVNQ